MKTTAPLNASARRKLLNAITARFDQRRWNYRRQHNDQLRRVMLEMQLAANRARLDVLHAPAKQARAAANRFLLTSRRKAQ